MDEKKHKKENFPSHIAFLKYRPSFVYRFKINKINFLVSTKRYEKFIIFYYKFTVFNLKRYYRRSLHSTLQFRLSDLDQINLKRQNKTCNILLLHN